METLKSELIASSSEAERASKELDTIRSRALQDNAQESLLKDRELRETQGEVERCRMERDEWERTAMQDRVMGDEARTALESLKRELELERQAKERDAAELELAREQSTNLQSVLEDFQAGMCMSGVVSFVSMECPNSEGSRAATGGRGLQDTTRPNHSIFGRVQTSCFKCRGDKSCFYCFVCILDGLPASTPREHHRCFEDARARKRSQGEKLAHRQTTA